MKPAPNSTPGFITFHLYVILLSTLTSFKKVYLSAIPIKILHAFQILEYYGSLVNRYNFLVCILQTHFRAGLWFTASVMKFDIHSL